MLSYEICKKLKEAGFKSSMCADQDENCCRPMSMFGGQHLPDLSELIKGCGDQFINLSKKNNSTGLEYWGNPEMEWGTWAFGGIKAFGFTPEEAVANLYLKINKK